jgi:GT2 family glycosyltransferase
VLHEDAIPEPDALKYLSQAAEISPSVAIIGPKLLELDNSIQIQQLGLTITPTGRPFLLVQREYDQGQHDRAGDTMAVSTAGMLVSLGVWQQLGGLDDTTPVLAQDLEFCAKARVAGYRVIVEANARVHHAGLSMQGKRPRSWLSGSFSQGISRAHLHFATLYLPTFLVFAVYLTLPLMVLLSIPGNLLQKRPGRSVAQFSGWIWAWLSLPTRLAARKRFRSLGSLKPLKALIATRSQRSKRRRGKYEVEPEASPESLRPGIFRSNSAWFVLLPLIASIQLFPTGAITANGILPLGANLEKLLPFVASNSIPVLDSIALPTDPFIWWLLLAAMISPAEPSLGFAALVFAALSMAFFGAWQLGKLFISKPWVITLAALGYSLSPQLLTLKSNLAVVELLAASTIPWVLFFLIRAIGAFNSARAWRWTGLLGLALALLAAASPIAFAQLPFDHPLYVLYSSGTTGIPKCIVHGAGGILLKHLCEHVLNTDTGPGDRLFYFSTCGWMMWNWLVSGLAAGATLLLYDGSPFHPSGRALFDYADAECMTVFGTSAKYIDAVKKAGPNKFKMGGTGSKQEDQIITVALEKATGTKFTYIPFKGGGDVAVQLVGNHIDSSVNNPIEAVAQWRAGKLRAQCVFDDERMPYKEKMTPTQSWNDVPTCKEVGVPTDYVMLRGIFMAPGVTQEQIDFYINLMKKVRETAEWKKFMADGAFNQTFMTGKEFNNWLTLNEALHKQLMTEAGFLAK